MSTKRVIVKGGGHNLFYVSESSGTLYVYKAEGGKTQIGKVAKMDDALSLIRSYSGRDIERIE